MIGNPESHWLVTVLNVRQAAASFKLSHSGGFDSRVVDLDQGLTAHVGTTAVFRLIEVREDRDCVRIEIDAPKTTSVHRLEVWQAVYGSGAGRSASDDRPADVRGD